MVPSQDFGGKGEVLHFLHANGYPPACYRNLLVELSDRYRVKAMLQRPLWEGSNPNDIEDWLPLSSDLILYLEENRAAPALVIGHSLGAIVILRAAIHHPEYFRAIILMEPVLFLPNHIYAWQEMLATGKVDQHPIIIQARNRRQTFDDLERIFGAYRNRQTFRYLNDQALHLYIQSITCPTDVGSYRLCYSAAWEERIYKTGIWRDLDIWDGLSSFNLPTLIIRGAETDTFMSAQAERMQRAQPQLRIETVEKSTHLVPMERPDEVAAIIFDFLSGQGARAWPT
jgi:pimeloyl-ACP methyl ester carboxylesterase